MKRKTIIRYALLSVVAAIFTIALKASAYVITDSISLLSDALESIVNLVAAVFALVVINAAHQPPDDEHEFGHGKVEYFSSGVEGTLIIIAALSIFITSINRLLNPKAIEQVGIGLGITVVASLINLFVARVLINVGHQYDSIVLEADGQHLMTDVWTSAGVFVGVIVVNVTDIFWLDPVIAIIVASNILWTGWKLIRRSVMGLIGTALPAPEREKIEAILDGFAQMGVESHALRTEKSGSRRFVNVHVLVPGDWSIQKGHDLVEDIESEIRDALPRTTVFTHIEPIEDPLSREDIALDRGESES